MTCGDMFVRAGNVKFLAAGPETPEQPKPEVPEQKASQKPSKPGAGLPQTGDDSMLPIAACGVAGVALVATVLVIRKRRKA